MKRPGFDPAGRWSALALLLLAVAVLYLVTVHWWWTVPQQQLRAELADLQEQEVRLRLHAQQEPMIRERLAQVRAVQAGDPGFLAEPTQQLATAGLVQELENVVRGVGSSDRCQLAGTTPVQSRAQERYPRVVVQVRLRCGMEDLAGVLGRLESGRPELFIDNLVVRSLRVAQRRGAAASPDAGLDVSFELYGYLNRSEAAP